MQLEEIQNRLVSLETKFEKLISKYESKLGHPPFKFTSINKPEIIHNYSFIPLTEGGVENKIFYKQSIILRDQFIQFYKYYKDRIKRLTEYFYDLKESLYMQDNNAEDIEDSEVQNLYYENLQNLLVENLVVNEEDKFVRAIKNEDNKIIYLDWLSVEDSILHSRFNDYFEDGLLAATRERQNGVLIKDVIYGLNQYSKDFMSYIYDTSFSISNYNSYTEILYAINQDINELNFYTLNNKLLGSIIYTYDENRRLIDEVWFDRDSKLRHFTCTYELGAGKYRVTERDGDGNIIYQDIVNSLDEEKFIKRK
tara:strand:- start:1226 stop:2155 length:930 start_codon:yes stop_codon:yes gene_type:complete